MSSNSNDMKIELSQIYNHTIYVKPLLHWVGYQRRWRNPTYCNISYFLLNQPITMLVIMYLEFWV